MLFLQPISQTVPHNGGIWMYSRFDIFGLANRRIIQGVHLLLHPLITPNVSPTGYFDLMLERHFVFKRRSGPSSHSQSNRRNRSTTDHGHGRGGNQHCYDSWKEGSRIVSPHATPDAGVFLCCCFWLARRRRPRHLTLGYFLCCWYSVSRSESSNYHYHGSSGKNSSYGLVTEEKWGGHQIRWRLRY